MKVSIPEALHICPDCEKEIVAGDELCDRCYAFKDIRLRLEQHNENMRINSRSAERELEATRVQLQLTKEELVRARRATRHAIVGLICWPGLAALSILALPYLFRAVFFLERVIGGQQ